MDSRRLWGRFHDLLRSVYADEPAWIEPLRAERLRHISDKNPFFQHAEAALWIATRDGQDVGRISAQVDDLYIKQYGEPVGFFGMLEAEDNAETVAMLLQTAESWLRARGMRRVMGPFNFSINEECGLLVKGFDTPPQMMMPHGRPYYSQHVEACGYAKEQDLIAYHLSPANDWKRGNIEQDPSSKLRFRPLSRRHMAREIAIIRQLYNDAWSASWGFVEFTEAELDELAGVLKYLVHEDFVWFAELDGEPVGFIATLPNLNYVAADLGGRLLPFGWVKFLWRLKIKPIYSARMALLGIRKDMHASLAGARLTIQMIKVAKDALVKRGVEDLELSWVLESNRSMRSIIKSYNGDPYKRYRIYSKELEA